MHQDESKPGGDYVAKIGISEMFARLREMGVQVFILSGHGEGSDVPENVLSTRKRQMVNLIGCDERQVHFGLSSEDKARYVRALQRTGTLDGNQPCHLQLFCLLGTKRTTIVLRNCRCGHCGS